MEIFFWAIVVLALLSLASALWAIKPSVVLQPVFSYSGAAIYIILASRMRRIQEFNLAIAGLMVTAFVLLINVVIGLAKTILDGSAITRSNLLGMDPNLLAMYLVLACLLVVAILLHRQASPLIILPIFIGFAYLVTLTQSRTGVLALFAIILALILTTGKRIRFAVVIVLIVALASSPMYASDLIYRFELQIRERNDSLIDRGRNALWPVAWDLFVANPVGGIGAGNYAEYTTINPVVDHQKGIHTGRVPHNAYLSVASELGTLGILLNILIGSYALRYLYMTYMAARKYADRKLMSTTIFLASGALSILLFGVFFSIQTQKLPWVFISLIVGLYFSVVHTQKELGTDS